jgi:hypothetical protein
MKGDPKERWNVMNHSMTMNDWNILLFSMNCFSNLHTLNNNTIIYRSHVKSILSGLDLNVCAVNTGTCGPPPHPIEKRGLLKEKWPLKRGGLSRVGSALVSLIRLLDIFFSISSKVELFQRNNYSKPTQLLTYNYII